MRFAFLERADRVLHLDCPRPRTLIVLIQVVVAIIVTDVSLVASAKSQGKAHHAQGPPNARSRGILM